jgi:copper chaperone CopZ
MQPSHDEIAKLAYQFYLEDGRPEGESDSHWSRAEEFLRNPQNHSDTNVLSVPSEPELTQALDEKARDLDVGLPSDPRSDGKAIHQKIELALDPKKAKPDMPSLQRALAHIKGIESLQTSKDQSRVIVSFDARRTNPAAIHEAILNRGYQPAAELAAT